MTLKIAIEAVVTMHCRESGKKGGLCTHFQVISRCRSKKQKWRKTRLFRKKTQHRQVELKSDSTCFFWRGHQGEAADFVYPADKLAKSLRLHRHVGYSLAILARRISKNSFPLPLAFSQYHLWGGKRPKNRRRRREGTRQDKQLMGLMLQSRKPEIELLIALTSPRAPNRVASSSGRKSSNISRWIHGATYLFNRF